MAGINGVGAIMIYSDDPKSLAEWYSNILGIETMYFGGSPCYYGAIGKDTPKEVQFSIMEAKSPVGTGGRTVMVNYQVDGWDEYVSGLEAKGITIEMKTTGEYGSFAHITDPSGNRIEIWGGPPAE